MVTEKILVKTINATPQEISSESILVSGDLFSGSIYYNGDRNSWIQFSFVNKEKLSYIVKELKPNSGVYFEIQIYAKSSKKI